MQIQKHSKLLFAALPIAGTLLILMTVLFSSILIFVPFYCQLIYFIFILLLLLGEFLVIRRVCRCEKLALVLLFMT